MYDVHCQQKLTTPHPLTVVRNRKMKEEIFISDFNYELNKNLVIEGDENSVWAYIVDNSSEELLIELDGFLCSRGKLIESTSEAKQFVKKGFAPPLHREFANEFSIHKNITSDEISILWEELRVKVLIKNETYLILDLENKISYSKSISKNGPYGMSFIE